VLVGSALLRELAASGPVQANSLEPTQNSEILHASEAAFWASLLEQMAALMQTIPDIDGTEIIIETTGNQFGDEFHQLWRRAQAGENEFIPIFLPWSIDPTYRTGLPNVFTLTAEEKQICRAA